MPPTDQQLATLDKFHRWTKSLFGKAEPCFSCKHHVQPDGMVQINRGSMRLQLHQNGSASLYDYSAGCCVVVLTRQPLEEVLMAGLTWAIRRKFHESYPS